MKNRLFSLIFSLMLPLLAVAQERVDFNVVPHPRQVVSQKGDPLKLSALTAITYEGGDDMRRNADFLAGYVRTAMGKSLPVADAKAKGTLLALKLDKKMTGEEAYRIIVSSKGVVISGATPEGVFRGVQTFRKAMPVGAKGDVVAPAVVVEDSPRFSYRGMHLDVSRHFFDVDFVKKYIDMLALHHINVFHFHISDDQGWRVEIKKYPRLTEVGAWRQRTVVGRNTGLYEHKTYGGFYTQEQVRDIVEYARERYVTVIPEIDMPGHMEAALASYPELGCTGGPYEVEPNWGVFDDILCAGRERTFEFVEGVLEEIIQLFPSEYIHIGGDEVPRTRWKVCNDCQQRIRQEGLRDGDGKTAEDRLQGYFMKRVEKYLNSKGRKVIGWDELLDCDVNSSTTIMSWRGVEGGQVASQKGHDVIMVPTAWFYFDYYQTSEDDWSKPLLIGGHVPLEKVYSFEPVPETMTPEQKSHVIGLQANLWTEYIYAEELAQYQVLPRMGALSEVQWVLLEKKDYGQYKERQARLNRLYDTMGWKYCKKEF